MLRDASHVCYFQYTFTYGQVDVSLNQCVRRICFSQPLDLFSKNRVMAKISVSVDWTQIKDNISWHQVSFSIMAKINKLVSRSRGGGSGRSITFVLPPRGPWHLVTLVAFSMQLCNAYSIHVLSYIIILFIIMGGSTIYHDTRQHIIM